MSAKLEIPAIGVGAKLHSTEADRRAFVEQVRRENKENFGPPARRAVETMLSAGHPHPWAYVYELTAERARCGCSEGFLAVQ